MQPKWRLSHARGYLELGMVAAASAELRRLSPDERSTPEALLVRAAVLQEQKRWGSLRLVARTLVRQQPGEPGHWITWAYASRRSQSLEAAERILEEAVQLHPKEPTIHFNLGCYAALRGDLETARSRVDQAIEIDSSFKELARTDDDLIPLHEEWAD